MTEDSTKVKLVGFSDASRTAYSAVIYVYIYDADGNCNSNLLIAKSKVAPVKTLSILRLELCSATLLAKLMSSVKTSWLGKVDEQDSSQTQQPPRKRLKESSSH